MCITTQRTHTEDAGMWNHTQMTIIKDSTLQSWKETEMSFTCCRRAQRENLGPRGVNWANSYASAASQWNPEWMWAVTLGRMCSEDTQYCRGRLLFNAGIKTTKYLCAEGVNHVERECSFCVEGRAKAMIQKNSQTTDYVWCWPISLCLHLFIPLLFFPPSFCNLFIHHYGCSCL